MSGMGAGVSPVLQMVPLAHFSLLGTSDEQSVLLVTLIKLWLSVALLRGSSDSGFNWDTGAPFLPLFCWADRKMNSGHTVAEKL